MPRKALIYEDNPINSKLLKMFVEQCGYTAQPVTDLQQAENILLNQHGFIVVDSTSPHLDFNELKRFAENMHPRQTSYNVVPAILCINGYTEEELALYKNIGIHLYVRKPLSVTSLLQAIEDHNTLNSNKAVLDMVDFKQTSQVLGITNEKILIALYDQFFISTDQEIRQMYEAIKTKDYNTLSKLAHSIKGACRNLRLMNLGCMAEELELNAKEAKEDFDFNAYVNNLSQICQTVGNKYKMEYHN